MGSSTVLAKSMNVTYVGNKLPSLHSLCTIKGDLSNLRNSLVRRTGSKGWYYQVDYDIAIRFGGTQLQATVQWKEGVGTSSPLVAHTTHFIHRTFAEKAQ